MEERRSHANYLSLFKPLFIASNRLTLIVKYAFVYHWHIIYSIIETCKMNGLRPVKYIAEVLRKLIGGETDYRALLPVNTTKEY